MNTHADKTQDNKSQPVSAAASQTQSSDEPALQVKDNRPPEAAAQRTLQEMANNSPQVSQLRSFQAMANNSPDAKKTAQLQAIADSNSLQPPAVQRKENHTGLPDILKTGLENLSGMSLDDVKVHRNSDKPAQLQAHAYAQGTDIHIASGQEKHLPHEVWHVVQQKQGRVMPTAQLKGMDINEDTALEKEADMMGAKSSMENSSQLKSHSGSGISKPTVQRTFDPALRLDVAELTKRLTEAGYTITSKVGLSTWFGAEHTKTTRELSDISKIVAAITSEKPGLLTAPAPGVEKKEEAKGAGGTEGETAERALAERAKREEAERALLEREEAIRKEEARAKEGWEAGQRAKAEWEAAERRERERAAAEREERRREEQERAARESAPKGPPERERERKVEIRPGRSTGSGAGGPRKPVGPPIIVNFVWMGNGALGTTEKFNLYSWRALGHTVNIYALRFDRTAAGLGTLGIKEGDANVFDLRNLLDVDDSETGADNPKAMLGDAREVLKAWIGAIPAETPPTKEHIYNMVDVTKSYIGGTQVGIVLDMKVGPSEHLSDYAAQFSESFISYSRGGKASIVENQSMGTMQAGNKLRGGYAGVFNKQILSNKKGLKENPENKWFDAITGYHGRAFLFGLKGKGLDVATQGPGGAELGPREFQVSEPLHPGQGPFRVFKAAAEQSNQGKPLTTPTHVKNLADEVLSRQLAVAELQDFAKKAAAARAEMDGPAQEEKK